MYFDKALWCLTWNLQWIMQFKTLWRCFWIIVKFLILNLFIWTQLYSQLSITIGNQCCITIAVVYQAATVQAHNTGMQASHWMSTCVSQASCKLILFKGRMFRWKAFFTVSGKPWSHNVKCRFCNPWRGSSHPSRRSWTKGKWWTYDLISREVPETISVWARMGLLGCNMSCWCLILPQPSSLMVLKGKHKIVVGILDFSWFILTADKFEHNDQSYLILIIQNILKLCCCWIRQYECSQNESIVCMVLQKNSYVIMFLLF